MIRGSLWLAAGAALGVSLLAASISAEPVKIRMGHGAAAEEQLWLMKAMPEITPQQGKLYSLEFFLFPATDKRFQAYEAGALDGATGSGHSVVFAASEGVRFKAVASISRESSKGFNTQYMVKSDSGITSLQQLKGKNIGVNGLKSSIHLWAILALKKAGLDPERDVTFVPVAFSAQGETLRSGKIDVGAFPQPFALMETKRGNVNVLFSSREGVPFDEELILLLFRPYFVEKNKAVVAAFVADFVAATKFYLANPRQSRQALIDAKIIRIPPDVYFAMQDYYRTPDGRIDIAALKKMQDLQIEAGFQRKKADIDALVDQSFLPN